MLAEILVPLTIATLLSGPQADLTHATLHSTAVLQDTAEKEFEIPEEFRIPLLNKDIVKRLADVKTELAEVAKKHPELGGGSLGIAMQSKSYTRFEKSEPFKELVKKHKFADIKEFFTYYNEVVGALFILNVEKQLDQRDLTEAQGFKASRQNKNFVAANQKYIEEELKLGDTYVGEKPPPPPTFMGDRDNRFPSEPPRPMDPINPMDPMDPMDPMNPMDPMGR